MTPMPWTIERPALPVGSRKRPVYEIVRGHVTVATVREEDDAELITRSANVHALLVESLAALVQHIENSATNSFCELCGQHAPKDDSGVIIGPVPHSASCEYMTARAALKLATA